jgi:Icc-related predicted phosphoesterase
VLCFFTSDLHGSVERYDTLFGLIADERPGLVLLGGDLLPMAFAPPPDPARPDFIRDFLAPGLDGLRGRLGGEFPAVVMILGNDDPAVEEEAVLDVARSGLWHYAHNRRVAVGDLNVYGYSHVPPSPFMLKDWERYDVSRFVDPGSISPEGGRRSVLTEAREIRYATIAGDLERLVGDDDVSGSIFLFHSPPYDTSLDRAALDGRQVDHVPLDVHVGSIAIRRFIRARQPLITLHGHVHESARLTGSWTDRIGRTYLFGGAHDGPELALVRFDPERPDEATRELH